MSPASTRHKADLIVIGAGIIGASIAYHAAKAGADVALVDARGMAEAPSASWASAGGLRTQGRSATEQPLTKLAAERWRDLGDELNADLEIAFGGHLHLAETEQEAGAIEARIAADAKAGLAIERVTPAEIAKIAPALTRQVVLGAFTPGDGQAHPGRTTKAYGAAAVRLGAALYFGAEARLLVARDRVVGAALSPGTEITAPTTVLATGAWSNRLLAPLGLNLAMRGCGLQMQLSEVAAQGLLAPTVTAVGRNLSLKQLRSGALMLGGRWQSKPDGTTFIAEPIAANLPAQWAEANALLPPLADLCPTQNWAGTEAQAFDHQPFIGAVGPEGLYVAAGFSNHGFQISPAVGALVADAVFSRSTPHLLAPFTPARSTHFDQAAVAAFQSAPLGRSV